MRKTCLAAGTALLLSTALPALLGTPAMAQGSGDFFIPPGGAPGGGARPPAGARPPQAQPPRPPQPPQGQRPRTEAPPPLPPGQQPPAAVLGIVDIPEVQRVSTAFNAVREEIERRRQRLNDDLQREQNTWREQQQQLANQRASLPPDQLRARERELQDRITDSQRIFRERSRAIEQVAQAAVQEIEQALGAVIRQVAASRHVNVVLPRPLVIFNEPAFDLTEEVAAQFNRALRTVTIPPEGAAPAAPASGRPAGAPAPAGSGPAAPPTTPPAAPGPRR